MMVDSKWIKPVVCFLMLMEVGGFQVPITYVHQAVAKGAVCLDGSPPAYHFDKGFGAGLNNWLIHMEGGGVCYNEADCNERAKTDLGSSKLMSKNYSFSAILSNKAKDNPQFYNWNRVKVRYCDGSCYTGDIPTINPNKTIYYRGGRVWRAVIDHLLAKGLKNAQSNSWGCSAGGIASIYYCDVFRSLLPPGAKVKCFSDAGFFIDVKDIKGRPQIERLFAQVVATHGSKKNLPAACISKFGPELCFFTKYAARFITTPLFLLNSAYDSWQIRHSWIPESADPHGQFVACRTNLTKCTNSQIQTIQGFREEFIVALDSLGASSTRGYYINSCFIHCQSETQETWLRSNSPMLGDTTIAKAVGDWFTDRHTFRAVDCPYPCDKSCYNRI